MMAGAGAWRRVERGADRQPQDKQRASLAPPGIGVTHARSRDGRRSGRTGTRQRRVARGLRCAGCSANRTGRYCRHYFGGARPWVNAEYFCSQDPTQRGLLPKTISRRMVRAARNFRMAVVCETCETSNRDAAQYCRGCSGKLPAFYAVPGRATAPASLRAGLAHASTNGSNRGRVLQRPPFESKFSIHRKLKIRVTPIGLSLAGGLVLALLLAIGLMWYLGQSAAARIRAGSSAGTAQAATANGAGAGDIAKPLASSAAVPRQRSERDTAALAAADAAIALLSTPPERTAPDKPWVASIPPDRTTAARAPAPTQASASALARVIGRDPTAQCAALNFFSRAICVNNVCADSVFASHPQCQAARRQRQHDEARRNTPN